MCGIVGRLNFVPGARVSKSLLRDMADAIRHRGPDDEGFYTEGPVGLGFRRLAIIDLSPEANQPLSNEDGSVWIVFNGEVYNFLELRTELIRRGHHFRTKTDTECIVHLYEEHGEACIPLLRGMFAFALWDVRKQKLVLARDRLGKKPLKFFREGRGITFASEIKALFRDPAVPHTVDPQAIADYLTFQYVPGPRTGFRGIEKLPPAHYLVAERGKIRIERYWTLDFNRKVTRSAQALKEETLARFEEAVKLRLMADVPLGAFLSGGIDSGLVVAMMARNSSQPVRTFSIGFPEASFNELPRARRVAERFSTNHTEFLVEPKAVELLPRFASHFEEPFADASAIPTWYVSELSRQDVTVALTGDGGDENFAGYPWYVVQKLAAQLNPWPLRLIVAFLGGTLGGLRADRWSTFFRRAELFARTHRQPHAERYVHYFTSSYFAPWEKAELIREGLTGAMSLTAPAELFAELARDAAVRSPLDEAFSLDIRSYLADDLLVKVDLASMAHSLEARSPFLDHEFLEFTATIPSGVKLPGFRTKGLLRSIARDVIPRETAEGPKRGFMVPLGTWFRGPLRPHVRETLLDPHARIFDYLRPDVVRRYVEGHARGRVDHGSRLWSLLTLEHWLRSFFPVR